MTSSQSLCKMAHRRATAVQTFIKFVKFSKFPVIELLGEPFRRILCVLSAIGAMLRSHFLERSHVLSNGTISMANFRYCCCCFRRKTCMIGYSSCLPCSLQKWSPIPSVNINKLFSLKKEIHLRLSESGYGSLTFVCGTPKEIITVGGVYTESTGAVSAGISGDGSTSLLDIRPVQQQVA